MAVDIRQGHVIDVLAALPERHYQTVVTSPPYWALRRYDTPPQIWGAADGCDHEWGDELRQSVRGLGPSTAKVNVTRKRLCPPVRQQGAFCQRCGAWRGELGSEPEPSLFVEHLVSVFDAVWRVLRDDGTLWVNLGDSYASGWACNRRNVVGNGSPPLAERANRLGSGLKEKDLCLIPFRFALAMQARGWWVRSVIPWCKTAPMPESVTDRPTSAWEPIFLFTKAATYFYDSFAVRQPSTSPEQEAHNQRYAKVYDAHTNGAASRQPGNVNSVGIHSRPGPGGANLRNWWLISPEPLRDEEHYAAYPSELVRRPILAGTSERGCCPTCSAPWRRVTEVSYTASTPGGRRPKGARPVDAGHRGATADNKRVAQGEYAPQAMRHGRAFKDTTTTGWAPTCSCPLADPVPCRVLDIFGGSGTTAIVADQLGRDCTLIELNATYAEMARRRVTNAAPLFVQVAVTAPTSPAPLSLFDYAEGAAS